MRSITYRIVIAMFVLLAPVGAMAQMPSMNMMSAVAVSSVTQEAPSYEGANPLGCYEFSSSLSVGAEGESVIRLQRFLVAQGLLSQENTTGYFGPLTKDAVTSFQARNGVSAVGVVGPLTRTLIKQMSCVNGTVPPHVMPSVTAQPCVPRPPCLDAAPYCQINIPNVCPPSPSPSPSSFGGQICPADAMRCPDGSYVGRTGPNCSFVCSGATVPTPIVPTVPPTDPMPPYYSPAAPVSCVTLPYAVSSGMQDETVTQLQQFLISQGLLGQGNVTGYFGPLTARAVATFQASNGISATGYVGDLTRAMIEDASCKSAYAPPSASVSTVSAGASAGFPVIGAQTVSCVPTISVPNEACAGGAWTFRPSDNQCNGTWFCTTAL